MLLISLLGKKIFLTTSIALPLCKFLRSSLFEQFIFYDLIFQNFAFKKTPKSFDKIVMWVPWEFHKSEVLKTLLFPIT